MPMLNSPWTLPSTGRKSMHHIKLAEGPSWISMMGIGKVVGQVRASVLDYRADMP